MIFANSNVTKKRFLVCLGEDEILELPEDYKKIYKQNIVDRYIYHPTTSCVGGFLFSIHFDLSSLQDIIISH